MPVKSICTERGAREAEERERKLREEKEKEEKERQVYTLFHVHFT